MHIFSFLAGSMSDHTIFQMNPVRKLVIDQLDQAIRQHNIHGMFELDITLAKQKLKEHREAGRVYSFTAYLIFCLAQTLEKDKTLLSMPLTRSKAVYFDEVDVNTIIEKRLKGGSSIPICLILRDAGRKSLHEINKELREAQKKNPLEIEGVKERRKLLSYPGFIRRFLLWRIHKDPFKMKKYYGNVALTSLNFFNGNRSWYGIPITAAPICLLPAGTFKKLVMENGKPVERDFCTFTFTINHDIIDGGPASRFGREFSEKVENAYGL